MRKVQIYIKNRKKRKIPNNQGGFVSHRVFTSLGGCVNISLVKRDITLPFHFVKNTLVEFYIESNVFIFRFNTESAHNSSHATSHAWSCAWSGTRSKLSRGALYFRSMCSYQFRNSSCE